MEMKDIKAKSDVELAKALEEARGALHKLRFKDASGQLKAVRDIRHLRSDIARIMTEAQARKLSVKEDSAK
jgi:ribosomal protein L29